MRDFLLDDDGDLRIEGGDLVVGTSDDLHKQLLLISEKGSFKENPDACVGLGQFLEAEDAGDLMAEIRKQLVADGMSINRLLDDHGKFALDAYYP